jgi:hypothetical protein
VVVGHVPQYRSNEKVWVMKKIAEPAHVMNTADRVTYGIVAGVILLAIFAMIFLQ